MAVENSLGGDMDTRYTSRSLRRRRNTDQWECSLSHTNPVTGEVVRAYHTLVAKTQRHAERARDTLILELERKGGAVDSSMSVREFMNQFLAYKEGSSTKEPSTARGYRAEAPTHPSGQTATHEASRAYLEYKCIEVLEETGRMARTASASSPWTRASSSSWTP
jgi:hypothetical protein